MPAALQQALVATPGKLTTAAGGAVMTQHAADLALTQALLDRPAFDYCFNMKVRGGGAVGGCRMPVCTWLCVMVYAWGLGVVWIACDQSWWKQQADSPFLPSPLPHPSALNHLRPSTPPPQDYLPPVLHATFLAAATEFVWLPWKAAMEESLALEGATQGGSQAVRDAQQSAEAQAGWLREALSRQFTEKLLKQVGRLEVVWIGA